MGLQDFLGKALSRGGDILSRPGYAVGNTLEALLAYQANRPFTNDEGEQRIADVVGETNPLKAFWDGLSGHDKVGTGEALARLARANEEKGSLPGWAAGAIDNPLTKLGANIVTDPFIVAGSLGEGGRVASTLGKLSEAGQADDASRFAQIASRILKPETVQNLDIASKAAGSTGQPLVIPGAALLGAARNKFGPLDEFLTNLFTKAAPLTDDVAEVARGPLALNAGSPVVNTSTAALNDLGTGLEPFVAAERVGQPLSLGTANVAGELNPAPIVRAHGPIQEAAARAIGGAPETLAIERGGAARAMGDLGPIPAGGASAESRMEALRRALGGDATLSKVTGNRGAGGKFLTKQVVSDAEELRGLLNNPETRNATIRMLYELVG